VAYIRFIVANAHPDSGVAAGIFTAAYGLRGSDNISGADRDSLQEQLKWFLNHLPIPKRFNRSRSKGYYRRNTKGIAWLRDTALEHISRMHELKRIHDANGVPVHIVREDRVGYVVYKDHVQVIAEPFSDTETGP
jgi:hypothetical protein